MRRGFLINSTVLVLIIPLLLLFATYEDVSSQILQAQAERVHLERTENVVGFLNLEFQRFLEIAGKRAVVTVVDYVSTTGNFIDPNYGANNSIRDLILTGSSSSFSSGYNSQRMMGGQTIQSWLTNVSALLKKQGYEVQANLSKIISSTEITVALVDSFTVVIKARISQINITDSSGRIIYSGPIPSNGKYVYSFVDITNIEDAFFSAITGGRYYRPIVACEYPFPTLGIRPITIANASGSGNRNHYVGRFGVHFDYNETHIWQDNEFNVTNFTIGRIPVKTEGIILNDMDTGIIIFNTTNGGGGSFSNWCLPWRYRLNVTIKNAGSSQLVDFQVPIYLDLDSSHLTSNVLNTLFTTADGDGDNIPAIKIYDQNCNPVSFWVETWDTRRKQALIWVKVTIPANSETKLGIYFDPQGSETLGDPNNVFEFYDDFESWSGWEQYENGVIRQSGDVSYYGEHSLQKYGTSKKKNNDPNGGYKLIGKTLGRNIILEGYVYRPTNWGGGSADRIGLENSNFNGYSMAVIHSSGIRIDKRENGIASSLSSKVSWDPPESDWYFFRLIIGQSDIIFEVYNKDSQNKYNVGQGYQARVTVSDATYNTFDRVVIHGGYVYYVDSLRIRKYSSTMPATEYSSTVETKPQSSSSSPSNSLSGVHVYDIQSFIDCLEGMKYFATENGWSFFERLEGSNQNHRNYVILSESVQRELGYSKRPIGLVSFMIPHAGYDPKLVGLLNSFGIGLGTIKSNSISNVDYYFMNYYFGGEAWRKNYGKKVGYPMLGVSSDAQNSAIDLEDVFYIDSDTATELFTHQGACDLLVDYNCRG